MNRTDPARRIVVIGGGIAGLAAAQRLVELDPTCDVTLLEASGRVGGALQTERQDGFLFEHGADGFITNVPWAVDLCRRMGIGERLLTTNPVHRKTFVLGRGRLRPIPDGFAMLAPTKLWPIVSTRALGLWGKLRLACEPLIPARGERDESLASFARRRLGRQTYERLVQPLIGAIHTGDPERLSMQAILPRFVELERQHGSLVRALWRQRKGAGKSAAPSTPEGTSGARFSLFVAPREGMQSLAEALAARLPEGAVRLRQTVDGIERDGDRWRVAVAGHGAVDADGLIVATSAPCAGRVLRPVDDELAQLLQRIPHERCAVVSLGYRRDQIAHPLDGFGFVVPSSEPCRLLCCSFTSVKYAERAPEGSVLLRAFVGGAGGAQLLDRSDEELQRAVEQELGTTLGVRGRPVCCRVSRPSAMPQYYLGHTELVERIRVRTARLGGVELAGNAYEGVGVPQCIRSGQQAAERVIRALGAAAQTSPAAS